MEDRRQGREPVGTAVFAAAAVVLGLLAMDDVGFRDSGELGTAGFELGVAHPTGFAMDLLWLRLSALLPLGSLALRQNRFTAVLAAGALGMLARLCAELVERTGARAGTWAGALTAVVGLGSWATFFIASRAVEVYASALLAVSLAALLLLRSTRGLGPTALLIGLSPGLHVTAGLYALILAVGRIAATAVSVRGALVHLPALGAGALVIAYLPLASTRQPAADWGDPETVSALWSHLTAARIRSAYQDEMLATSGTAGTEVVSQLFELWPLALPAALGVLVLARRARGAALAGLFLFAADLGYAVLVNPMGAADRQVGHVAGAMVAVAAGLGVAHAVVWLGARRAPGIAGAAVPVLLCGLCLWRFDVSAQADGHAAGELFGSGGPLGAVPARSLIICATDDACAAGSFALYAEGVRPDLDIAPAQHLWDHTVIRRLDGFEQLGSARVPTDARGDAAAERVKLLALARWSRPVLWESAAPLERLGYPGHVAASPVLSYAVPRPIGENRGWPAGIVRRLDRARQARLPGGRPTEARARIAWSAAYSRLGERALTTRGTMEGIAALRIATELEPRRAVAWINLGVALETVADLPGAIEATRRALELEPTRTTAWVNLARLHDKQGDRQGARQVLELAARAGVQDARLDAMRGQWGGVP